MAAGKRLATPGERLALWLARGLIALGGYVQQLGLELRRHGHAVVYAIEARVKARLESIIRGAR